LRPPWTNPLRWQRLLSIQIYSYLDPQELLLYLQERLISHACWLSVHEVPGYTAARIKA
jgi:hypothetical protein